MAILGSTSCIMHLYNTFSAKKNGILRHVNLDGEAMPTLSGLDVVLDVVQCVGPLVHHEAD